jgi:hypothetical protein
VPAIIIPGSFSPDRLLVLVGGLRLDCDGAMSTIIPGSAEA